MKANKVTIPIKIALKQNKIKKCTFDNPNVFKDNISLLFFNLTKTQTEDKNKIVEIQGKEIVSMKRSLGALRSQVSYLMMKEMNDFLYNREDSASSTK